MKKRKHIIEGKTKLIVQKIVDKEVCEWPPYCATIYYQPLRPKHELKPKKEDSKE